MNKDGEITSDKTKVYESGEKANDLILIPILDNSTQKQVEEDPSFENQIIKQIADENKEQLAGTTQNFRSMIESKIFQSSNYKDYQFD